MVCFANEIRFPRDLSLDVTHNTSLCTQQSNLDGLYGVEASLIVLLRDRKYKALNYRLIRNALTQVNQPKESDQGYQKALAQSRLGEPELGIQCFRCKRRVGTSYSELRYLKVTCKDRDGFGILAKALQEDVLKCSECKHDIPRTDDSANILCAGCANKLKLNALSQVGDGGDKSVKVHTSVGHLGPSLEEYQPQKLVMEAEPGKRVFGLTFGRSSSNQRVNDIHSDIVDGFLKELMMPLQWTSSGKEVIPGLAGRTLINGAHQFGNGAFEYSMLAKLSRSNGRVYAYVPLDLKSNGCTEEDIVIMAMTCPDNFGTGNPYHLVEFLKYVATMAPVSLDNVNLASIGTQQEEVLVVNELNVVCAQDIIICLCDGVWPVDDNKYTHLMRFLYRMAQGVLARRFTGNNLSRKFTSDSHHVVEYQHEFQQSSRVQQQSSSQQSSRKHSSQQQSSSRYPCDHPACGAVLNSAVEYRTHVAKHQQKVDKPFRRMKKNCDKAYQ
ncbi:hypothetical protein MIR68_012242 [Amoeboaphelidium protococcarum]|nr:hypothetical protein MIR68_012242 [Amoeboaphelidium protococcarum]